MRKLIEEPVIRHRVVSIICDCCEIEYTDDLELQEFFCCDNIGGYSSVFGDGVHVRIDICQHCMKKLLGNYIQYPIEEE